MRISDWSSDVCSSDLRGGLQLAHHIGEQHKGLTTFGREIVDTALDPLEPDVDIAAQQRGRRGDARSEEHTSELQSLMRLSYAVFSLKKTKTTQSHNAPYPTPVPVL